MSQFRFLLHKYYIPNLGTTSRWVSALLVTTLGIAGYLSSRWRHYCVRNTRRDTIANTTGCAAEAILLFHGLPSFNTVHSLSVLWGLYICQQFAHCSRLLRCYFSYAIFRLLMPPGITFTGEKRSPRDYGYPGI